MSRKLAWLTFKWIGFVYGVGVGASIAAYQYKGYWWALWVIPVYVLLYAWDGFHSALHRTAMDAARQKIMSE